MVRTAVATTPATDVHRRVIAASSCLCPRVEHIEQQVQPLLTMHRLRSILTAGVLEALRLDESLSISVVVLGTPMLSAPMLATCGLRSSESWALLPWVLSEALMAAEISA